MLYGVRHGIYWGGKNEMAICQSQSEVNPATPVYGDKPRSKLGENYGWWWQQENMGLAYIIITIELYWKAI